MSVACDQGKNYDQSVFSVCMSYTYKHTVHLPVTNSSVHGKNMLSSHGGQRQDVGGKVTQKLLQMGNI